MFILTPSSALSFVSDGGTVRAFPPEVALVSSPRFKALEAGRDGRKGCLALICSREELVKKRKRRPPGPEFSECSQVGVSSKVGGTLFYNNHRLLRESVCSLFLPHRIIETACPQKLFMSTLLDHCSLLEHDNQICDGSANCQVKKKVPRGISPASTTVRRRCAMNILVRALSRSVALIFFMSSDSVCASSAAVYVHISIQGF